MAVLNIWVVWQWRVWLFSPFDLSVVNNLCPDHLNSCTHLHFTPGHYLAPAGLIFVYETSPIFRGVLILNPWRIVAPYIGLASGQPADIGPPMLPTKDWGLEHSDEHLSEPLVIPIPCPRVWLKPGMGTVGVAGDGDPGTRQCCCLITSSMAKSVTKFLLLASPSYELSPGVCMSLVEL